MSKLPLLPIVDALVKEEIHTRDSVQKKRALAHSEVQEETAQQHALRTSFSQSLSSHLLQNAQQDLSHQPGLLEPQSIESMQLQGSVLFPHRQFQLSVPFNVHQDHLTRDIQSPRLGQYYGVPVAGTPRFRRLSTPVSAHQMQGVPGYMPLHLHEIQRQHEMQHRRSSFPLAADHLDPLALAYDQSLTMVGSLMDTRLEASSRLREGSRESEDKPEEKAEDNPEEKAGKKRSPQATFPFKMFTMLSDPLAKGFIWWLPHGRAFKVIRRKGVEERILSKYFRSCRFESFQRQLNGWGFKRILVGPDTNAYYHDMFIRGLPDLCLMMIRPKNTPLRSTGEMLKCPDFNNSKVFNALDKGSSVVSKGSTEKRTEDSEPKGSTKKTIVSPLSEQRTEDSHSRLSPIPLTTLEPCKSSTPQQSLSPSDSFDNMIVYGVNDAGDCGSIWEADDCASSFQGFPPTLEQSEGPVDSRLADLSGDNCMTDAELNCLMQQKMALLPDIPLPNFAPSS